MHRQACLNFLILSSFSIIQCLAHKLKAAQLFWKIIYKKALYIFSPNIIAGQMVQILLFNHPYYALSIFSSYALFWRYHIFVQAFHLRQYFKWKHWNFPSKGGKILSLCRKDMFLFKKKKQKKRSLLLARSPAVLSAQSSSLAALRVAMFPLRIRGKLFSAFMSLPKDGGLWSLRVMLE